MRLIKEDTKNQCNISFESLKEKFYSGDTPNVDPSIYDRYNLAVSPPTVSKVSTKLKNCENTVPSPDRLTYYHLKKVDEDAKVLALIFNICLKAQKIPKAWKISKTVLIPKPGDPSVPENWHPVSLSSTIYKLFSSLIAKRISEWIEANGVLSRCQKGFRPFDGTIENNYLLKERIQSCRRSQNDLCLLLFDVKNAFGSIFHEALLAACKAAGVGDTFLKLISDLYSGNTTHLLTAEGLSESVDVCVGVKKGCPLSGPMFNITIDPIFSLVQERREDYHILGYADDIAILEESPEALQESLDKISSALSRIGLSINPRKCATVHIKGDRADCVDSTFKINGTNIPVLRKFDYTKYLGKPVGFNIFSIDENMDGFLDYGTQILTSNLATWQRIDALKSFFYPSLNYAMRTDQFGKDDWKRLDDSLRPLLKKTLNLPDRASNDFLYGNSKDSLFGVPLTAEDSDIARIDTAFKLLMSIDPNVKVLAWDDLKLCTSDRITHSPGLEDMENFLSNVRYSGTSNYYSSVWARARAASGRLGVK